MSVHDSLEYRRNLKKLDELERLLIDLDKVADILYDSISYGSVWDLIKKLEETRHKYYMDHFELSHIVKTKGRV